MASWMWVLVSHTLVLEPMMEWGSFSWCGIPLIRIAYRQLIPVTCPVWYLCVHELCRAFAKTVSHLVQHVLFKRHNNYLIWMGFGLSVASSIIRAIKVSTIGLNVTFYWKAVGLMYWNLANELFCLISQYCGLEYFMEKYYYVVSRKLFFDSMNVFCTFFYC